MSRPCMLGRHAALRGRFVVKVDETQTWHLLGIKFWSGEQETFVIIYRYLRVLFRSSFPRVCSSVVLKTSVKVQLYLGIS